MFNLAPIEAEARELLAGDLTEERLIAALLRARAQGVRDAMEEDAREFPSFPSFGYIPPSLAQRQESLCPCGKPLHYLNWEVQWFVEDLVARLGESLDVQVGRRAWRVPRHYIALHGLKTAELPALAREFGFEEVQRGDVQD